MIGGKLNGLTLAWRMGAAARNVWEIKACADCAASVRSWKGFNRTTIKAEFGSLAPSSSEKPMIDSVCSRPGSFSRMSSTCLTTALVRDTEAPSGNCTAMKNAP